MKSKTIFIMIISLVMILMMMPIVKADDGTAYSAKIQFVPDKTEVKPGETINISVKLTDIKNPGSGANMASGTLTYDNKFFSDILQNGKSYKDTQWLNAETGKILIDGNNLTTDGELSKLQFKVSDSATGSTTLKFTNLTSSNGNDEPTSDDVTLTFNIKTDDGGSEDPTPKPEEPKEDDGGSEEPSEGDGKKDNTTDPNGIKTNNGIKVNTSNGANGGTTTKTTLPKAGMKKGFMVVVGTLLIIITASYVSYKRYQKIEK